MASRTFVLATRHSARNLEEFFEVLGKVRIYRIIFMGSTPSQCPGILTRFIEGTRSG